MYKCIFFVLSYIILAVFLGVAKKKEPLIVIDEKWEYINKLNLQDAICYFAEKKPDKNKNILYQLDNSYEIAFAVERFQRAKRNYDKISHHGYDLQGYIGYAMLLSLHLLTADLSFWIVWLCIPVAVIGAIVAYKLTVKFLNRDFMYDVVYIEFEWNDNKALSPENFEKCNDFLKSEKSRCLDRLTSRADAYEQALYLKKYYINIFRWASVFGVITFFSIISNYLSL